MNRQEQIERASADYQCSKRPMAIGGDAFADMVYKMNINPSFVAGAQWADKNPNTVQVLFSSPELEKIIEELRFQIFETTGSSQCADIAAEGFINGVNWILERTKTQKQ